MTINTNSQPKTQITLLISGDDRVNGDMVAALLMACAIVLFLFAYWLSSTFEIRPKMSPNFFSLLAMPDAELAIEPLQIGEPGIEEFPEIETPELAQALLAVNNVASSVRAHQAELSGDDALPGPGKGTKKRIAPDPPDEAILQLQRWRIQFSAESPEEYARKLSFFKIDLAAVHQHSNDIVRLSDPGGAGRVIESSRKQERSSLYFVHEQPEFARWEEQILKKKGVAVADCLTVQFYPDKFRTPLLQLEQEILAKFGKTMQGVHQTIFKVVPNAGTFDVRVEQVIYRRR